MNNSVRILSAVIRNAETQLAVASVDNPALDARVLTALALGLDRAQLLSQSERVLTEREQTAIAALIARRAAREPVSRILQIREFWGLPFALNEATLVPRPDSETVVEAALKGIQDSKDQPLRVLDLGTGSGCLLLALLHELPNATGLGVDRAPRAVEQAGENAKRLGLAERVTFKVSNWADGINERFDLIVSNPPYIERAHITGLMPEVRDHDPHLALDGGADGLEAYRALIPQLPGLLKSNGIAAFEVGEGQAQAVAALFQTAGFTNITTRRDLGGIERCVIAHIP